MVGIGFFAPLPLALMMPFMAGQSMLMGDAFGKAYQYGKRKISAMTNEEFNKLTPQQLGQEIATDYSAMIPSLQTAIKQSSVFQSMIIQEMAKIIRSLPSDIVTGVTGNTQLGENLQSNLQGNIEGGTQILASITNFFNSLSQGIPEAHATNGSSILNENRPTSLSEITGDTSFDEIPESKYSQAIFRAMPLDELVKGINNGRFTGSDLSLARSVLKTRQEPEDTTLIPTTPTSNQVAHQQWQHQLSLLQQGYLANKSIMSTLPTGSLKWKLERNKLKDRASKIRRISLDFRNPNNSIRRDVLKLRQQIQNGNWT